jgi:heme-degrading monooxygenase HmoA
MYVSVRCYEVDPDSVDEIMERAQKGYMPMVSKAPGFIAYYVLDAGDGVVATISVFESQAEMEESSRVAAEWVKENLAPFFPNPPRVTSGKVGAYKAVEG